MTEYRKPSTSRSGPRKPSGGGFKSGGRSTGPRKEFSDRKPRSSSGDGERPRFKRDASGDSRPKRDFGDRPRRDFSDRPKRDFGDRPAPRSRDDSFGERRPPRRSEGTSSDRPKRDFGDRPPRREFNDRPARSTGDRDRPKRDFGDRPKRDFGDRPARPRSDSTGEKRYVKKEYPPRGEYRGDGPSYDRAKRDFGDRPKREGGAKPFAKSDNGAAGSYFGGSGAEKREEKRKGHEHVIYGLHAVAAVLNNEARQIKDIWVTEAGQKRLDGIWDVDRHPEQTIVDKNVMERLLPDGAVHQGIAVAVEPLQETFLSDVLNAERVPNAKPQLVVVLDEVTDPHNVGAVMRSMAMFGAKALIVHKYNAPTVTGALAKTATGAVEHVPMVVVTNLATALEELQIAGFYVLGLDEKATVKLTDVPRDRSIALVLGAEGEGLRAKTRTACDAIASIPSFGPISSLNVSNAAAIAMYEVTRG